MGLQLELSGTATHGDDRGLVLANHITRLTVLDQVQLPSPNSMEMFICFDFSIIIQ